MANPEECICRTWLGIASVLNGQEATTAARLRYINQWKREMEMFQEVFEEGDIGLIYTYVPHRWCLFDGDLRVASSAYPVRLTEYALNDEHCVSDVLKSRCLTLRLMYSMVTYLKLEASIPNDPGTI